MFKFSFAYNCTVLVKCHWNESNYILLILPKLVVTTFNNKKIETLCDIQNMWENGSCGQSQLRPILVCPYSSWTCAYKRYCLLLRCPLVYTRKFSSADHRGVVFFIVDCQNVSWKQMNKFVFFLFVWNQCYD